MRDNKEIARWFSNTVDAIARGEAQWPDLEALVAPEFSAYWPLVDFHGFERLAEELVAGFPDCNHTFEDQIADGDEVASRITWNGTHRGTYKGVHPTHRAVEVPTIQIVRVEDEKVAEFWRLTDTAILLRQITDRPATETGGIHAS